MDSREIPTANSHPDPVDYEDPLSFVDEAFFADFHRIRLPTIRSWDYDPSRFAGTGTWNALAVGL